jgi:ABC-type glycerol-3-phosphate transport system substrate-binding protein
MTTVLRSLAVVGTVAALGGVFVYSEMLAHQQPPPGPVHVTYWEKWTGFEFDAMKAVVDDFNASQNKIFVDILSTSNIQAKTLLATSAGVPPDIAGLASGDVAQYADDHAATLLDDYVKEAGISEKDYVKAYWDIGVYDGHIYSLPSVPASTALHYNKTLLRQAGLDPEKPPTTFKELDEMAKAITKKRPDGKLQVAGFIPAEPGWWNFGWGFFFGGKLLDENGKITANSKENVRAFEWVADYSRRNGADVMQAFKQGFGNFSSPQNAFMSNEVAMEIQGVWMYNFIHTYQPNMDWGAAPFPHPEDRPDLANGTIVDEDTMIIPRGAKHPKEAFEFIKYVQSQPAMEKLCLGQLKNSPLSHVSDHFWKTHKNPRIRLFYDLSLSKNSWPPPKTGMWAEYNEELNAAFDSITLLSKTPKQALDEVVARMQPKMDQYMSRLRRRKAEGL